MRNIKKFLVPRKKGQRGFTLVELVVVLGIMAALAAIVVPVVARFAGRGDTEANKTELDTVQAAMDLFISDTNPAAIAAQTTGVNDFGASSTLPLYPAYMRSNPTKCYYTWDAYNPATPAAAGGGHVTQVTPC